MICRTQNGGYAIHPCVEINLRMNMGVVARLIYDNYVCDGVQGRYVIEYYAKPGEAWHSHLALQEKHPLYLENGKVKSGYLSLTPVENNTSYQAYILNLIFPDKREKSKLRGGWLPSTPLMLYTILLM